MHRRSFIRGCIAAVAGAAVAAKAAPVAKYRIVVEGLPEFQPPSDSFTLEDLKAAVEILRNEKPPASYVLHLHPEQLKALAEAIVEDQTPLGAWVMERVVEVAA